MRLGLGKLGRAIDPTVYISGLTDSLMQGGWKTAKNFTRGVRGKHKVKTPDGEVYERGAMGDIINDIKNRGKQVFTGREYDKHGVAKEAGKYETVADRFVTAGAGAVHLAGDLTIAPVAAAAGWTTKQAARVTAGAGLYAGKHAAKVTGRVTKEAIDYVGDTAIGGAELVNAMNHTNSGRLALFGIGAVGATAIGLSSIAKGEIGGQLGGAGDGSNGIQFEKGDPLTSIPGTVTPSSYEYDGEGNFVDNSIDDMGADGDLVFAMHNMR